MSDTDKIIPRPRASLAEIELPDGDTLISREVFAREVLGVCTRTATRMNLPTTHVGGIAYVKKNAALKIVGDAATRRNQPPKRRRV